MIWSLGQYAAYKDSGLPWLGKVPKQWEVDRPKWLFHKMNRPVRDSDGVVTCFRDGMVTLRKNRRTSGFTEALKEIGYQGIRKGDLVIHAMDAFAGAVGVSDSDGKGSPVYSVCQAQPNANAKYYAYVVREMARSQWLVAMGRGIRERSTDFRFDDFACSLAPLPPVEEQDAIVRYLDYVDRRVRKYIRAKQELIALLTEQKQAVIQRGVTRGLDPNVRLKPSGVPWLGDIPEHWQTRRLKYVFSQILGGSTPQSNEPRYWDGEVVWVTPIDVGRSKVLTTSIRKITPEGLASCSTKLVPPNSIIVTSRAPVGNVAIASIELCTNQGCKALVANVSVIKPHFAFAVMSILQPELQSLATGTTFEISTTKISTVAIPLPPLSEQELIVAYLEDATRNLDAAIEGQRYDIDLLRECRTSLIADVVTGKLDVREAAANLPDEPEEEPELVEDDAVESEDTSPDEASTDNETDEVG
jgi:type I restriction enzyme S subunit